MRMLGCISIFGGLLITMGHHAGSEALVLLLPSGRSSSGKPSVAARCDSNMVGSSQDEATVVWSNAEERRFTSRGKNINARAVKIIACATCNQNQASAPPMGNQDSLCVVGPDQREKCEVAHDMNGDAGENRSGSLRGWRSKN
jgi:hypothetical protein